MLRNLFFLLVLASATLAALSVSQYTNMTTAQVASETTRWFNAQATACQAAGGNWTAGFSTAGCDVDYTPPATPWYVTPVQNPWYEPCHAAGYLLVVLTIVFLVGMCMKGSSNE